MMSSSFNCCLSGAWALLLTIGLIMSFCGCHHDKPESVLPLFTSVSRSTAVVLVPVSESGQQLPIDNRGEIFCTGITIDAVLNTGSEPSESPLSFVKCLPLDTGTIEPDMEWLGQTFPQLNAFLANRDTLVTVMPVAPTGEYSVTVRLPGYNRPLRNYITTLRQGTAYRVVVPDVARVYLKLPSAVSMNEWWVVLYPVHDSATTFISDGQSIGDRSIVWIQTGHDYTGWIISGTHKNFNDAIPAGIEIEPFSLPPLAHRSTNFIVELHLRNRTERSMHK